MAFKVLSRCLGMSPSRKASGCYSCQRHTFHVISSDRNGCDQSKESSPFHWAEQGRQQKKQQGVGRDRRVRRLQQTKQPHRTALVQQKDSQPGHKERPGAKQTQKYVALPMQHPERTDPDSFLAELALCGSPRSCLTLSRKSWRQWHNAGYRVSEDTAEFAPSAETAAATLRIIANLATPRPLAERVSLAREPFIQGLTRTLADAGIDRRNSLRELSPKVVASGVWSIASLAGPYLYMEEMETMLQLCNFSGEVLEPAETADLLWGLGTSRHLSARMYAVDQAASREGGLSCFGPEDLSPTLWGFATLGVCPALLVSTLPVAWVNDKGPLDGSPACTPSDLTAPQLTTAAWALVVMGQSDSPPLNALWVELCERGPHKLRGKHNLLRIHQVAMSLDLESQTPARKRHPKAGRLMAAARHAWMSDSGDLRSKRGSHLHREIAAAVRRLGLPALEESSLPGYSVDITIPSMNMVLEADGPSHFNRTTGDALGSTLLKHRLLKAMGWNVLSIRLDDWEELIGPEERQSFLKSLFGGATSNA
mmetsp:Transcript_15583/g.43601  ORF Transcript_15583/g.43601 Transcript_15583/m.43601 type:complete len:538 (+) Transcript_15583:66-1679(+)